MHGDEQDEELDIEKYYEEDIEEEKNNLHENILSNEVINSDEHIDIRAFKRIQYDRNQLPNSLRRYVLDSKKQQ